MAVDGAPGRRRRPRHLGADPRRLCGRRRLGPRARPLFFSFPPGTQPPPSATSCGGSPPARPPFRAARNGLRPDRRGRGVPRRRVVPRGDARERALRGAPSSLQVWPTTDGPQPGPSRGGHDPAVLLGPPTPARRLRALETEPHVAVPSEDGSAEERGATRSRTRRPARRAARSASNGASASGATSSSRAASTGSRWPRPRGRPTTPSGRRPVEEGGPPRKGQEVEAIVAVCHPVEGSSGQRSRAPPVPSSAPASPLCAPVLTARRAGGVLLQLSWSELHALGIPFL